MQPTCSNMFQNDNITNDFIHGLVNDQGFEDMAISMVIKMCFGLLNAFVKFKIGGSNQSFFSKDRHFSILCTYNNAYSFIHVHINIKRHVHIFPDRFILRKSNTCLTFNVHCISHCTSKHECSVCHP